MHDHPGTPYRSCSTACECCSDIQGTRAPTVGLGVTASEWHSLYACNNRFTRVPEARQSVPGSQAPCHSRIPWTLTSSGDQYLRHSLPNGIGTAAAFDAFAPPSLDRPYVPAYQPPPNEFFDRWCPRPVLHVTDTPVSYPWVGSVTC